MTRTLLLMVAMLAIVAVGASLCQAQSSSIYQMHDRMGRRLPGPPQINATRMYIPSRPAMQIRPHDIVSIRVDELARMTAEGEMERRKIASYDLRLQDWIMLKKLALKPAPQNDGDPRIRGQLNQLYRAEGDLASRESVAFNIAANVVEIRPNGNLVLEAHRDIQNNNELWRYSLSGICRRQDVGPDNVILSRDIANMHIHKEELGSVRDSYRRGFITRIYDLLSPF